jgi:hypothetical protein
MEEPRSAFSRARQQMLPLGAAASGTFVRNTNKGVQYGGGLQFS